MVLGNLMVYIQENKTTRPVSFCLHKNEQVNQKL